MSDIQIVTGEPGTGCKACGREKETRMGYCWDCATAESIIHDGTDMWDNFNAKTSMDRVKALLKLGWKPPEKE